MPRSVSSPARRPPARLLWAALCSALLPACVFSSLRFGGELPGADAVASIRPGHTTCAEVLDLLGPPEEYVQPVPMLGLRTWDPQDQRVLDEREVFRRRTWTWLRERRDDTAFFVPLIFAWTDTAARADRIVVTFDAWGVVTAVGADGAEGAR